MKRLIISSILTLGITAHLTAPSRASLVYSKGHADFGVAYDAGQFDLHFHAHQFAVIDGVTLGADAEDAPDEIVTLVPAPSVNRPAGASWAPLGIASGQPFWFLPQVQDVNKPFLGLATEELNPADWTGPISLKLTAVSGTGVAAGGFVSLWDTDVFGDKTFYWTSADGLGASDKVDLVAGSHSHYNYAFTKAGTYDFTLEATGLHNVDGLITSSATYSFDVAPVPEPTTGIIGLAGLGVAALSRRRRRMV